MEPAGLVPQLPVALTSLVAGGFAGLCTDVSLYPLDTLKTRLQSAVGFWRAGGFRGVYKGLTPAMVGSVPAAALFWCTYDACKALGAPGMQAVSPSVLHVAAAICGELTACIVRVPVENVKQKLQAQVYTNPRKAWVGILAMDGPRGFYIGSLSTVARDVPFAVIQFPLYERLKRAWSGWKGHSVEELEAHKAAMCGSVAGAVAAGLTTPMDVVKTRLMLTHDQCGVRYKGSLDVVRRVCREEGFARLFAGVTPRMVWIGLGGFVFFGSCEGCKRALNAPPASA